ncbi:hypothetical protein BFU36_10375 [Sulfolobus sp. A20]|uniref:hypothetical protein n=1 Tax=Saccharolobus sp. A20 TaxID=1891280 RepID=UPI0008460AF9|nr:hypothetical protein [Sulfolobus sp. A20]TRM77518.1 hypothetical protein DJ532_04375 [Sulfolobus sp. A20-N-F8]TRM83000.1 hypothetical protein DJ531_07420 [Sulfolobus sp. A20-N-F6]TRM89418.1 hypothetical protein DJ529_02270 [Sulfolobus sp. C3]TRM97543.1 hypothetical protein DJ527_11875 [Sulfolobus sp. F1]TRM99812.1 hypothetical protein DJ530_08285 [Sulfolobus sp. E1]
MISIQALIVIFVISFVTNATPFLGAPYTLIATSILLKSGVSPLSLILVIICSGLGASLSKTVMYTLGIAVRKPLKNNKNILFLERISKSIGFYLTLFIFSIFPFLPLDDYIFLASGIAKLGLLKLILISIVGKIVKSSIEISIEVEGIQLISSFLDINVVELSIISIAVFAILGYILLKIDWEFALRYIEKFLRDKLKINI